ncbi:MAG: hypothetical protein COX65_09650 [Elusimicrobia bacterium CG_4_10_14_0_2_um_filter_56_8]|nr:MAG: hypothetical protein AUJ51_08780 [Elusimicrobia bacterium CG1_02_56_21]PJA11792.1 MAG: hypothetical protein COX65_09650 [Elusimicrobia bacterium CG_4_10_14_0_2_um_filter_56_8]
MNFKSLCSGSGGNSALLWTAGSAVLIDFAPGCQRDCRAALRELRETCATLNTVLVTHAHGDHINRNSLRVLSEQGFTVRCHPEVRREILKRHGETYSGIIKSFEGEVHVGDLKIRGVPVDHSPSCYATAFIISSGQGKKASVFTDLRRFGAGHPALAADSDLLWLEANHDLELLKSCGHPGSEFHLSNTETARFLHKVCSLSARQPQFVVLGHLSADCNAPHLPELEIKTYFKEQGCRIKFRTQVAPRDRHGSVLTLK